MKVLTLSGPFTGAIGAAVTVLYIIIFGVIGVFFFAVNPIIEDVGVKIGKYTYYGIAGDQIDINSMSKVCSVDGYYDEYGDGEAVVLSSLEKTYDELSFVSRRVVDQYSWHEAWGAKLKAGCVSHAMHGKIEFPTDIKEITHLVIELQMPTRYPKPVREMFPGGGIYVGASERIIGSFENVSENLSSQPIGIAVMPKGTAAERLVRLMERSEKFLSGTFGLLMSVWLSSTILMFIAFPLPIRAAPSIVPEVKEPSKTAKIILWIIIVALIIGLILLFRHPSTNK